MLQVIWDFIQNNWLVIAPFLLWLWSEILALNPKWQSNSLVQLITAIFNKILGKKQ